MNDKTFCPKLIFSFLAFLIAENSALYAESFRVRKAHIVSVEQRVDSEAKANLGINDALAIKIPEDNFFIEGLELKFEIPEAVASWTDSVACSVYGNISPAPKDSQIDYQGTRSYVSTLPGKLSWVLQVPLKKENSLKSNKYTTKIDGILQLNNNTVFVRLQPVMKGVPEETYSSIVPITVKPILMDKGIMSLALKSQGQDANNCTIFIDDKITEVPADKKIILDTGVHNISVVSEAYRNEVRTVRIDRASVTDLTIEMKSIEPTLLITAPEGTDILLDNEKFTNTGNEFVISEGEHNLKFTIGDYEKIVSVNAIKGKTYKVNFSLDVEISEE